MKAKVIEVCDVCGRSNERAFARDMKHSMTAMTVQIHVARGDQTPGPVCFSHVVNCCRSCCEEHLIQRVRQAVEDVSTDGPRWQDVISGRVAVWTPPEDFESGVVNCTFESS